VRLHTDASKLRALVGDAGLTEERDKCLVGGLDQHELKRVTVEGNAFERCKDSVEKSASSNLSYS